MTDNSFIENLQQRDSILIADQLSYGVRLDALPAGTLVELPQVGDTLSREIMVVRPWRLDTLKHHRKENTDDIAASIVITSFDEGEYLLPDIPVVVHGADGSADTLVFKGQDILVCTMPVDTATFKINDIKGQIKYPLTFGEVAPWVGGGLLLAALVYFFVRFLKKRRARLEALQHKDPPHIVALRKLDGFRSDKFWAPARQKAFYSGVTDALREYIDARFGVGAMEMTTPEIFAGLEKSDTDPQMRDDLRTLFERADFVKFAKYVASDEENAGVLPLSVRFVTTTYQEEIRKEEEERNVL